MGYTHLFKGGEYEKYSQHQRGWGDKLIRELELRGDEVILDLGCGNGLTTHELAGRVPRGRVVGLDWSLSMIETAKTHKTDNMELRLQDINEINFREEFDVVFSNATLHWILDHEKLLKKIYSALKDGGFMRTQFAADGNCPRLFKAMREAIKNPLYREYFREFKWPWNMPKIREYQKLLTNTRFQNTRVWGENIKHYFPDEETMIGWVEQPSILPLLAALPEDLRKSFRDRIVGDMIEKTRQADGTYMETFNRINVYAVKSRF